MGDKLDRVKFAKICEMMTSSHEGERLSATARANEMLRAAGMTWTEALKPAPAPSSPFSGAQYAPNGPSPFRNPFQNAYTQHAQDRRQGAWKPKPHQGWEMSDFEYRDMAVELENHDCFEELDEKHQDFIMSMAINTGRPFTEKQREYLDGLAKKLARLLKTRQHHE